MLILDNENIKFFKKQILARNIKTIKIEKKGKRYYCEIDLADVKGGNASSKLMDLHEMICDIDIADESVTEYYLYYDIMLDDIIINKTINDSIKTSIVENDNLKSGNSTSEINEEEEMNYCLRTLVNYFTDNQVTKVSVMIGKKKCNVPVISMLSNMHDIIANIERTKNL